MIRREEKNLDQKKMPFWIFINNFLVEVEIHILKWDFENVWTKRSISEPLAKFRESDLENNVRQKLVKLLIQ